MEIVKGSSFEIPFTVYQVWTGDLSTSVPASLIDATMKLMVKTSVSDTDAQALITKDGSGVDLINGKAKFSIASADTNNLSYTELVYEILVKLAGGIVVRTGPKPFILNRNVINSIP